MGPIGTDLLHAAEFAAGVGVPCAALAWASRPLPPSTCRPHLRPGPAWRHGQPPQAGRCAGRPRGAQLPGGQARHRQQVRARQRAGRMASACLQGAWAAWSVNPHHGAHRVTYLGCGRLRLLLERKAGKLLEHWMPACPCVLQTAETCRTAGATPDLTPVGGPYLCCMQTAHAQTLIAARALPPLQICHRRLVCSGSLQR